MGFLIPLCVPLLLLINGALIKGQSTVAFSVHDYDPCNNYTDLDQPWRSNNAAGSGFCDHYVDWDGWYRLLYYGINVRMSESCVPTSRCGTYYTLWLNGAHPAIGDGVVTRQVCGNAGFDCCYFSSTTIRVKACPGNYHIYEFVKPTFCSAAYCTDTSTLNLTTSPTTPLSTSSVNFTTTSPSNTTFDPCYNYTALDDVWRTMYSYSGYGYYTYGYSSFYSSHDDTTTKWDGWYRLYLQGENAQIPEWCVYYMTSGGYTPLLLGGSHPLMKDGIVSREINGPYNYGYYSYQCNYYRSKPIQVKACPGHYYVYKLVRPDVSILAPIYTAVISNTPSYDPCSNYVSLDQPWRANTGSGMGICDRNFNWNGWYRLFYYGMNIRMPESCVDVNRCGTYYTLWLNGPHPQIEDGVVTRQVCGNSGYDCCYFKSTPIRVKACPGNYYVYEFLNPINCNMAYCSDANTITQTPAPTTEASSAQPNITLARNLTSSMFDPCDNYNVLDEYWRSTKWYYTGHDDTLIQWNGWYRLFLQGASAQIAEWCVSYMSCGGYTPLALGGAHPQVQDGIVTREVYGSSGSQCKYYRSNSIQVKACPGNYYVYKLVRPDVSVPMPSYCAVTVNHSSFDPCNTYTALDQPWRSSNETALNICDSYFNWNGWYRLFNHGMNTRMPESCVDVNRCGTYFTLWLNGPHPQIEDGVVTRQVCGNAGNDCCNFRTTTIQVKACPGNYYVYELVQPDYCNMAYCTDGSYITPTPAPAMPVTHENFSISNNFTTEYSFDPCENYTALNDQWRTTQNYYGYNSHDDTVVEWSGWYRLYLNGNSAQLPEWCSNYMSCGGYTPLLLGGSHPRQQDGIVTRQIYGSSGDQCKYYRSNSIQIKACPGQYYVYKLVKPDVSIPMPTYCTVSFNISSYDPCTHYTSLDQPWRASNATGLDIYDSNFNWNGWYRLFYYGMNIHMSESCVPMYHCGTYYTLWLNGSHPQIEDGVVARKVCGNIGSNCCFFGFHAIQVKACPGNYYVYQFTDPKDSYNNYYNYYYYYNNHYYYYNYYSYHYHNYFYNPMAYCTDASSITPIQGSVTTGNESSITTTASPYDYSFDPCYNHTVLNEEWRNIRYSYGSEVHDDTTAEWDGWYRLYLQGRSAQISEGCVSYRKCGGYTPLVLSGSHPREQDGIVTRSVLAFSGVNCNSASRSNPIQVKACPGHYYVYKLVRPDVSNIMPTYCAVALDNPSTDPCDNYNVLDQSWRATNNADRNHEPYYWWRWYTWCDSYTSWNGWYRLLYQGKNIRMPESCVNPGMCGTDIPLWLNGFHPRLEDGVVSRQVCGRWYGDCCYFKSFPIQVKACPGNYYVYEFVNPVICASAYCEDVTHINMTEAPTTAMVDPCEELNCTADEWCGESEGVYGCFCNENHPAPSNNSYDSTEECESSSGTMSLSRCQLFEAGFSANDLHLSDPNCTGTLQNGRLVFHFDNDHHICGSSLTANGTHFIYENTIQGGADSAGGPIHRKKYLELRFSCIYQISQTLSMDTELNPLESVVHKNLPDGQGMYQVRIIPYQDAALSQPYNGSVKIVVDERIYVGVFVQGVDSRQIATVIDSCWATPERDQHHAVRWDLITNRCPNPADTTVEVLQNGASTTGLFSFKMFAFNGNYQKVFLHCSIHLCLLQNNNCAGHCAPGFHRRDGRSVDIHAMASISVGPFIWTT